MRQPAAPTKGDEGTKRRRCIAASAAGPWSLKCPNAALPKSFYCAQHSLLVVPERRSPPPPPPPPPARVVQGAAPKLVYAIVGAALVAMTMTVVRVLTAHTETSAVMKCRAPSEHETLLVYINAKPDGVVEVACGPFVGGSRARR